MPNPGPTPGPTPGPATGDRSPAVFLDRDDTLIACNDITPHGDLGDPALVQLLPGVAEALRTLHHAGYLLLIFSNQGGVARGRHTLADVHAVNRRLNELVDGLITDFRVCPWHPKGTVPEFTREHPWRKPAPGMILDLAATHRVDLPASWVVGDAPRDCHAGRAAGCRTVLVAPSPPADPADAQAVDFTVPDIAEAARTILRAPAPPQRSTVTLRAFTGLPLADPTTASTVESAARAIAERQGVTLEHLDLAPDRIVATLIGESVIAVGFAAELRRLTERWYRDRLAREGLPPRSLWGSPPGDER